jgi:cell division transport system ATP-binding protein
MLHYTHDLLRTRSDIQKVSTRHLLAYDHWVIWLEGVSCQRDGSMVIDAVSLGVARSELIVIEGSAASGKSTLLELAAVMRMPDRGAVWFAGRNTASLQRASLPFVRRNIGYCTEDPFLLPEDTVLANVMMALAVRGEPPDRAEQAARAALALVKASDLESRQVASLSSGQKRAVALARAVAGPPPLVVVDEPAVGFGDEARATVAAALSAARDLGAAVLAATADTALADALVGAGGRRIHLEQGHIAGAPVIGLVPALMPSPMPESQASRITLVVGDGEERFLPPATRGPR